MDLIERYLENIARMKLPPDAVSRCEECGSLNLTSASRMAQLCPECAHVLYGYVNCAHRFVGGVCSKCLWDGSRSAYIAALLEQQEGAEP